MIRFWAICKNTFVQTIRQPIFSILVLVTFGILIMSLAVVGWTVESKYRTYDQKMLENLGLSTLLVSGLLIAAFSASNALSREIEDKTALTVISKPISRATFVLGKFAGVWAAVTAAFYLNAIAFLMTVRHGVVPARIDPYDWPVIVLGISALALAMLIAMAGNYFFKWAFASAAVWSVLILFTLAMAVLSFVGKEWSIVPLGYDTPENVAIHFPLLMGIVLILMAVTIFVAVAVTASTRLGQVMTLLICCAVFVIGAMHPYLFGYWTKEGYLAARVAGAITPNLTYFFAVDALMKKEPNIPIGYVASAGGYCALYVGGLLAMGMALFQRRQLEAEGTAATLPGAVTLLSWAGRAGALAIALVSMVMVTLAKFHTLQGAGLIAGLFAAAGINWLLWSHFATGKRWAYWLTVVLGTATLAGLAGAVIFPARFGIQLNAPERVLTVASAALAAAVMIILLMPKTRRHFKSIR